MLKFKSNLKSIFPKFEVLICTYHKLYRYLQFFLFQKSFAVIMNSYIFLTNKQLNLKYIYNIENY